MVQPGDDLAVLILDALTEMGEALTDDDVIVLAQKIVSKAENRYLDLRTVTPSEEACRLAREVDKDPRKVQAILDESNEVVRKREGVLIVEHRLGFVQANAGIDQSNISHEEDDEDNLCLLLPVDSDTSARVLREEIKKRTGLRVGVVINDSLGRAWRNGTLGLSIGVAGIPSASLVAIIVILQAVGFSPENIATGVGIVYVVDRILDMTRTAINVFGDSCAAVIIGKSEGESGYYENILSDK